MYFTKVLSLAFLFVCLGSSTFGQQCVHIGGGVITNIGVITPNRTLGTAIGDLKGAIGVEILTNLRGPWNDCLLGSRLLGHRSRRHDFCRTCSIGSLSRCTRSLRGRHLPRVDKWWDGEI